MTVLARLRVKWEGTGLVGSGVSTFYTAEADLGSFAASVGDFFDGDKGNFPDNVTWTIPHAGDTFNDTNGTLVGTWSETGTDEIVTGTVTTGFQMGAGVRVRWHTGGIHNGRRVVGTTYLVPLVSDAFTTNGILSTSTASGIDGLAEALVAAETLRIWSRPSPGGNDGASHIVTSASVPLTPTALRSRRS